MQNCALIQYGGESNMLNIDLNLLVMLNALLTECNVTKAAQRSNLSVSAMSRALNRLRTSLNDPLLMKSGRTMVLTPYALSIRAQVSQLMDQLEYVFVVPNKLDLAVLSRQFTLRASAGFAENYGSALLTLIRQQAPNATLRIISKEIKHTQQLKQGDIDAEISVITDNTDPELKSRFLFSDVFIGVCNVTHPLVKQPITLELLNNYDFIGVQRQYPFNQLTHENCACTSTDTIKPAILNVTGFSTAITIVSQSQLIAIVPKRFTHILRNQVLKQSLFSFPLPYSIPSLNISLLWHPKMHNDLAHKWFRDCILQVCNEINDIDI